MKHKVRSNKIDSMTFNSIADLKAFPSDRFSDDAVANVLGYYAPGDGGGGEFVLDLASVAADNGGTVIAPDVGSGRWEKPDKPFVYVEEFGAVGDGVADDSDSILRALSFSRNIRGSTGKVYLVNQRIVLDEDFSSMDLAQSVIKAGPSLGEQAVVRINGDNVIVRNSVIDGSAELYSSSIAFYGITGGLEIVGNNYAVENCVIKNQYYTQLRIGDSASNGRISGNQFLGSEVTQGAANVFAASVQPTVGGSSGFGARGGSGNAIYGNLTTVSDSTGGLFITENYFYWNRGIQIIGANKNCLPEVTISNNRFKRRAGIISGGARFIVEGNYIDPEGVPQFNEANFGGLCQAISGEVYFGSIVSNNVLKNFSDFGMELDCRQNNIQDGYDNPELSPLTVTGNTLISGKNIITNDYEPFIRGIFIKDFTPENSVWNKSHKPQITVTGNSVYGANIEVIGPSQDNQTSGSLIEGALYFIRAAGAGIDFSSQSGVTGNGAKGDFFVYNGNPVTFGTGTTIQVWPNFENNIMCGTGAIISNNNVATRETSFAIQIIGQKDFIVSGNVISAIDFITSGASSIYPIRISKCANGLIDANSVISFNSIISISVFPASLYNLGRKYTPNDIIVVNNNLKSNLANAVRVATVTGDYQTGDSAVSDVPVIAPRVINQRNMLSAGNLATGTGQNNARSNDYPVTITGDYDTYTAEGGSIVSKFNRITFSSVSKSIGATGSKCLAIADVDSLFLNRRQNNYDIVENFSIGDDYVISFSNFLKKFGDVSSLTTEPRINFRVVFGKRPSDTTGADYDFTQPFVSQSSGTLVSGVKYFIQNYVSGDDFSNLGATNVTGNFFTASGTTPTDWTNGSVIYEATQCFGAGLKYSATEIRPYLFYFNGETYYESTSALILRTAFGNAGAAPRFDYEIVSRGGLINPALELFINGESRCLLSDLTGKSGVSGIIHNDSPNPMYNSISIELYGDSRERTIGTGPITIHDLA